MTIHDRHFDHPVIEVLAQSPRLEALQMRLRQSGFRPVPASLPLDRRRSEPLLLDLRTIDDSTLLEPLIAHSSKRIIVALGPKLEAIQGKHVLHLRDVDQIPTLGARLAIRAREARRKREYELRRQTANKLGQAQDAGAQKRKPRVLFLGNSSRHFSALAYALGRLDVDVVAALTVLTAQDYLTSGHFDAIILHPRSSADEASKFFKPSHAGAMTTLLKYFVLEEPQIGKILDASALEQVTALFDARLDVDLTANAIAQHLAEQVGPNPFKTHSIVAFPQTGPKLFSAKFLKLHLDAQFDEADQTNSQLTLVSVRSPAATDRLNHLAATVGKLMRDTDLIARLSEDRVCISLPGTAYRGGVSLARRIEAATEDALEWRVIERRQYHTVTSLLSALTSKPSLKQRQRA